jgi:hypothetical protein
MAPKNQSFEQVYRSLMFRQAELRLEAALSSGRNDYILYRAAREYFSFPRDSSDTSWEDLNTNRA